MAEGGSMSPARWRRVESYLTRHILTAFRPRGLLLRRTLNICIQQSEEEKIWKVESSWHRCSINKQTNTVYTFLSSYKTERDFSKCHIQLGGIWFAKMHLTNGSPAKGKGFKSINVSEQKARNPIGCRLCCLNPISWERGRYHRPKDWDKIKWTKAKKKWLICQIAGLGCNGFFSQCQYGR